MQLGNGGTGGSLNSVVVDNGTAIVDLSSPSPSLRGSLGTGAFEQNGSGTTIFSGPLSSYYGAVTVNAGTLEVDGSIASSRSVTVNSGGVLTGTGTVSATTVNGGGTLAPGSSTAGTSLTISGSLTLKTAANYLAEISTANNTANFAGISGTATLTGATFIAAGTGSGYSPSNTYTVLTATGGLRGTKFSGLHISGSGNFGDLVPYLTYPTNPAKSVQLNLTAGRRLEEHFIVKLEHCRQLGQQHGADIDPKLTGEHGCHVRKRQWDTTEHHHRYDCDCRLDAVYVGGDGGLSSPSTAEAR